jgi:5-methylcytosine-specific restriction enzyme B
MTDCAKYIQKIIFGSPGNGKSYHISKIAEEKLGIKFDGEILPNSVKVVFHPEYTYSDFIGKLLPLSSGNSIIYKYYPGHFLQTLGMAYKALIDKNNHDNYLLVIDELNRGNASAIFGSIFQLLDRNDDGWSTYEVDISEMELLGLFNAIGYRTEISSNNIIVDGSNINKFFNDLLPNQNFTHDKTPKEIVINLLKKQKIKIPPNLSIIATINTSDESIYYLDSAFKRRWDWEYIEAPSISNIHKDKIPPEILNVKLFLILDDVPMDLDWYRCIVGVNEFLKLHHKIIRRIEDKQIGWWFIKPTDERVTIEQVKDKLMFYLWDSVFVRNKQSLVKFIEDKLNKNNVNNLATYADFLIYTEELLKYWHNNIPTVEDSYGNF